MKPGQSWPIFLRDSKPTCISLKIRVGTYIDISYFVYSQSIGEEWWEISIIFLVFISTKGTEESSALYSIIIDLIKTCSFCTQINFFVIRWWCMGSQFDLLDAETVILLSIYTNSMTVSEYICINVCWPIIQWWRRINLITYPPVLDLFYFVSISAFPQESRTRKAANFPSIRY